MAALRLVVRVTAPAALALALPGPAAAQASCPGAGQIPQAGHLRAARAATLCLINDARTDRGRMPLRASRQLRIAATRHSRDMVAGGYFAHDSRDGSTFADRIRRTGYLVHSSRGWRIGENIAWGAGALATPTHIVRAWMGSRGHRRNILARRFREIGIGIVPGAPQRLPDGLAGATCTTDFGRRG